MENLIKTTTLRFQSEKDGYSADITAVKDSEGNIKTLTVASIQSGDKWLGDLNLTADALTEVEGISALVAKALNEAINEGNESSITNTNENEN